MKSIAIFGGTFDPVHCGHLRSALALKQQLQLDELRMLPCHLPPHRETPGCDSARRLAMLRLACEGTALQVDDRELRRDGPSYSVDTLAQLRTELGPAVALSWVLGADAFCGLAGWHRWRELLDLCHLIVLARPGAALPQQGPVAALLAAHRSDDPNALRDSAHGLVVPIALTPYPIAASDIRARLKKGQPVDDLMCERVVDYIKTYQLYR